MRGLRRLPTASSFFWLQSTNKMSLHTVSSLNRISAEDLRALILSPRSSTLAVIDVRDDDHVGGHIKDSIHAPSSSLDYRIPELIRKLADKEIVVFHCALSQQRGPSAALRYLRERDHKIKKEEAVGTNEGSVNSGTGESVGQEVLVLDRGFVGWQKLYGKDEKVTEGYAADIWVDYDED